MQKKYIKIDGFIDPRWLRDYGYKVNLAVVNSGKIVVGGKSLSFYEDETPFPDGAEVCVRIGSGLVTLKSEEDQAFVERKRQEDESRQREIALSHEKAQQATQFNKQFQMLPFKWDVGIKDVLSGLSSSSWGDGRKKNTVQHILCLEPIKVGRIGREKGQFLCTSSSGSDGKRWSGQVVEKFVTLDGKEYTPRITCKKCIEIANKILNQ